MGEAYRHKAKFNGNMFSKAVKSEQREGCIHVFLPEISEPSNCLLTSVITDGKKYSGRESWNWQPQKVSFGEVFHLSKLNKLENKCDTKISGKTVNISLFQAK